MMQSISTETSLIRTVCPKVALCQTMLNLMNAYGRLCNLPVVDVRIRINARILSDGIIPFVQSVAFVLITKKSQSRFQIPPPNPK